MKTTLRARPSIAIALLVLISAACGGDTFAPRTGSLQVSVKTTGTDFDENGYEIVAGSVARQPAHGAYAIHVIGMPAGNHVVSLEGVARNCTVSGPHPRTVTVAAGQTADAAFEVVCQAYGIEVSTVTTGPDSPASYPLFVNDQPAGVVSGTGSLHLGRRAAGRYTVRLSMPDQCTAVGPNPAVIDVSGTDVHKVSLSITCVPAIRRAKIAFYARFSGNGSPSSWITLVNPDGSGRTELAEGESPAWSPDAAKLVFAKTECDYYGSHCTGGLISIDPETRVATQLAGGAGGLRPDWSPTGDAIVFTRYTTNGRGQLFVLKPGEPQAQQLVVPGAGSVDHASWSPDGQRLAFTCMMSFEIYDVCTMKKDGTGLVRLTNSISSREGAGGAAWSPDGSRIAFVRSNPASEIAVIPAEGGSITVLGPGSGKPAWSRDGTKLVFRHNTGLLTMNSDGSNVTSLTIGHHYDPAWRP